MSGDVLQVITITGMGDHHRLDQPITMTGIRRHNREVFWNEVEACGRGCDACLAREVEFALPAELLPYQAAALARDYVLVAFVAEGMAADLNVHWALRPDGQPKPYAQVLLTMRRIGAEGFGFKERTWNDRAAALRWR